MPAPHATANAALGAARCRSASPSAHVAQRVFVLALAMALFAGCQASRGGASASSGSGSASSGTGSSASASSGSGSTSGSGGTTSSTGSSGTTGSAFDGGLLRFAFTGDTRPSDCDDAANYPTAVIAQIATDMKGDGVRFALDTGDHVKICGSDSNSNAAKAAQAQLSLYAGAVASLGTPFYLTMGNHECQDNSALCDLTDPVLSTFMTFVQQEVNTTEPYYSFDVSTPRGVASFVFVADTAWNNAESTWLERALTHADASKYTFVVKHVPSSNLTDFTTNAAEMEVIDAHRVTLLLDSHAHTYQHADGGREITLGLGGAPLLDPSVDAFGYGLVAQQADGSLQIAVIDAASDTPRDAFAVDPN